MTSTSAQHETIFHPPELRSQVWLDHLPLDVCASIASFLKPLQHDPWALHQTNMAGFPESQRQASLPLASVSKLQRRAVEIAQAHFLHFETATPGYTASVVHMWRRVLRADIRELHLAMDLDTYREFGVLLSHPTVSKASIPCIPSLMRSLISGSTIKVLQLHMMRSFGNGMHLLPKLLRSCCVEELRLVCHQCDNFGVASSSCATIDLDCLANGSAFDSLRSLQLVCSCSKTETLVKTLSFFPNLEEFSLQRWNPADESYAMGGPVHFAVSPEFQECMRSLKSVGMVHYGTVEQLVPMLQERMTSFSCHETLSQEDVRKLEACRNLQAVDLILSEGAEDGFPTSLRSLRSISLKWASEQLPEEEEYYCPKNEFLVGLVRRNQELEELRLHCVLMSDETLERMLACVNRGIRILQIPVFHQKACPLERFLLLTRLLIRNDLKLSELEADITSSVNATDLNSHDASTCKTEACVFCVFPKQIWLAAQVLKKRMPSLRAGGLERMQLIFAAW